MATQTRHEKRLASLFTLLVLCAGASVEARAQSDPAAEQTVELAANASLTSDEYVRQLTSRAVDERQHAAEELARLAEPKHRRMVEGYRFQEKDARVKLALDWALYRMGKSPTLFSVVRDLDSKRSNQAMTYLTALESPQPLYIFLTQASFKTQVKLLEVLARIGDAETIQQIKPLAASPDPVIANAAKFAEREITLRLEQSPATESDRPRVTGQSEDPEP